MEKEEESPLLLLLFSVITDAVGNVGTVDIIGIVDTGGAVAVVIDVVDGSRLLHVLTGYDDCRGCCWCWCSSC